MLADFNCIILLENYYDLAWKFCSTLLKNDVFIALLESTILHNKASMDYFLNFLKL